jgi:hypothetical protein
VDGERSVLDICRESEIGDNETLKVALRAALVGLARVKGKKVLALDQDFVPVDTLVLVLDSFNQMYGTLQVHGARGRSHRGERAREVPRRACARAARTSSAASSSRRTAPWTMP